MLNIGFLVFPNFNILDLSGPLAAFDVPRREISPTPYRLTAYSAAGRYGRMPWRSWRSRWFSICGKISER